MLPSVPPLARSIACKLARRHPSIDAEDLEQEMLLRVLRIDPEMENPSAYLWQVGRSILQLAQRSRYRRRSCVSSRYPLAPLASWSRELRIDSAALERVEVVELLASVAALGEPDGTILTLTALGCQDAEIGAEVGLSANAVRVRRCRARSVLRQTHKTPDA